MSLELLTGPDSSQDRINSIHNYWGSSEWTFIRRRICDSETASSLPLVTFSPVSTSNEVRIAFLSLSHKLQIIFSRACTHLRDSGKSTKKINSAHKLGMLRQIRKKNNNWINLSCLVSWAPNTHRQHVTCSF